MRLHERWLKCFWRVFFRPCARKEYNRTIHWIHQSIERRKSVSSNQKNLHCKENIWLNINYFRKCNSGRLRTFDWSVFLENLRNVFLSSIHFGIYFWLFKLKVNIVKNIIHSNEAKQNLKNRLTHDQQFNQLLFRRTFLIEINKINKATRFLWKLFFHRKRFS